MTTIATPQRGFLILAASLGWLALAVQCCLMLQNRTAAIPETLLRFFGFFTILTNILVAAACTVLAGKTGSPRHRFFSKDSVLAAITLYIVVVGLVYNGVLRQLWAPQGMQRLVDELLHLIIPILFLIYWLVWAPKQQLKWSSFWPWLIYPLAYVIYCLIRGSFSGFYPYPFINVITLGYPAVFINSLGLTAVFIAFSLLLIGIARLISKRRND